MRTEGTSNQAFKEALDLLGKKTGHKINNDKSQIVLSKNLNRQKKQEIMIFFKVSQICTKAPKRSEHFYKRASAPTLPCTSLV